MRELAYNTRHSMEDIVSTMAKLTPKSTNMTPVRVGCSNDGGYILLKELLDGSISYSFGVGRMTQFEQDMASRNYTNYMYDPYIYSPNVSGSKYVFKKLGVSDRDTQNMRTIETIIKENNHTDEQNMILQCDIEGSEFDIFTDTPDEVLNQFSQIVIEYHWLDHCIMDTGDFKGVNVNYQKMKDTFYKLSNNFTPFHVHGNNWVDYFLLNGSIVPEVIEVSYVRNDLVEFNNSKLSFPTAIDAPNNRNKRDIPLGSFSWS